jgi:hypothetical protein
MSLHIREDHPWDEIPASEPTAPSLVPVPDRQTPSPQPFLFACAECTFGVRMMRNHTFRCRKVGRFMSEQPFVLPAGCPGFVPR